MTRSSAVRSRERRAKREHEWDELVHGVVSFHRVSGPQSAALSQRGDFVTARTCEPFAFMTTTSAAPSGPVPGVLALTILRPSGENEDER
jgi:hypothetical protein